MTGSDLLRLLAETNLALAAGLIVVMLARKGVRRLFGAAAAYGLWVLPALAALAVALPPRTVAIPGQPAVAASAPISALPELPAPALEAMALTPGPDLATVALWAWVAGAVAMGLWLTARQLQFLREVARGRAGPAVVGFLRPRVVLPADFETRFTRREQLVVQAHERTHLLRGDAQVNGLVALLRCLCWFNPLAHLGAHLMRVDQELACDASVIARYPKSRAPYAQALLKAELAARPLPLGCYWPARAAHPLTERMAMLQRQPLPRIRRLAGAAGVGALATAAGMAAWAAQPPHVVLSAAAPSPAAVLAEPRGERAPEPIGARLALAPSVGADHPLSAIVAASDPQAGLDAGGAPVAPSPDATQFATLDAPSPDRVLVATASPTQAVTTLSPAIVEASRRAPSTADLPKWSHTPTAAEMQAAYPAAAAQANYAASGTLECTVGEDGGLAACEIASESAPGFGAAALAVAPKFRLPTTGPSGASIVGRTVRPRIGWVNPVEKKRTIWTTVQGEFGPAGTVAFNCRVRARGALDNCVVVDASPRGTLAFAAAGQAVLRFKASTRFPEFSRIRVIVAVLANTSVPPDPPTSWNPQPQRGPG